MSDLKFYCPHCSQKIQCDEQWCGQKIQCPACQGELVVPYAAPAAPVTNPPQPAPPPLVTSTAPSRSVAPPPPRPPAAPRMPSRPTLQSRSTSSRKAKIIKLAAVIVVAGVGCYFGLGFALSWQKDLNSKSKRAAKESDGGQLGHIADLYSVLDATDPDKYSRVRVPVEPPSDSLSRTRAALQARSEAIARMEQAQNALPVVAPTWSLDTASATIPEARANGSISGTPFVADAARVDKVGEAYALTLRQGTGLSADREIVIYLRLKPGETLGGHTWDVSKDMPVGKVPQVVKRWKTDPKFAAKQKMFPSGYAMKLELGQPADGIIIGKIFIALPDPEQSVVAGVFRFIIDAPVVASARGVDTPDEP